MRKIIKHPIKVIPILFLFSLFNSCDNSTDSPGGAQFYPESLPAIDVPWTNQQSIVCFGTSLTSGFMWNWESPVPVPTEFRFHNSLIMNELLSNNKTNTDTTSYPALLGRTTSIRVYNQGYIGATTKKALEIIGDSIFSKNPALVLLEFGANDFFEQIDEEIVEKQLIRLIDTLFQYGSKVVLISFLNPEMISSIPSDSYLTNRKDDAENYLKMLRRVAESRSILFVENAMKGIYWNSDMMSDVVHPNRKGYQKMYENIYRALYNTLEINKMLK